MGQTEFNIAGHCASRSKECLQRFHLKSLFFDLVLYNKQHFMNVGENIMYKT